MRRRKGAWLAVSSCSLLAGLSAWLAPRAARGQEAPSPAETPPVAETAPASRAEVSSPGSRLREDDVFQAIGNQVSSILAKCKGAIVRIQGTDRFGAHVGTGFLIDTNGTIYTHYAVGGASWGLTVELAEKKYPAKRLLADQRSGLTMLQIQGAPTPTPFLTMGRSEDLKVASPLVAIGYPLDLPIAPSFGLIAGFDQRLMDHYLSTTHIRANVPVQAGEQGAPLLNSKGEVVGILAGRLDYGAACVVLPIRAAEKVRNDYVRYGEPRPGWVGVTIGPTHAGDDAELKITDIAEDAPAAKSGLEKGDVLLQVGGTPIRQPGDLQDASFYLTADETVPIIVRRGEQKLTFSVRAIDPPGSQAPPDLPRLPQGAQLSLTPRGP